jgi:hypothetical protein
MTGAVRSLVEIDVSISYRLFAGLIPGNSAGATVERMSGHSTVIGPGYGKVLILRGARALPNQFKPQGALEW